jgi:hypothetical protein
MCGPVQMMMIQPRKVKDFSEMREICENCPLNSSEQENDYSENPVVI